MFKEESSNEKEIKRNWMTMQRIFFILLFVFIINTMILKIKLHFNIFISLLISINIIIIIFFKGYF